MSGDPVQAAAGQPSAAERTTSASVLRGGAWNATAYLVPQAYVLVLSVVAARFLGPDGMGRQSFIAFVSLSATMLFTGGMPFALSRFIGEALGAGQAGALRGLLRWVLPIEAIGATLAVAGLVAIGLLGADPAAAWVLAGGVSGISILQTIPAAVLTGTQGWRVASSIGLVTGGATTVGTIAVLAAGGGIVGMFAVELAGVAVGFAATSVAARRALRRTVPLAPPSPELRRRVARFAAVATVNVAVSFVVWRRSEFLFLERYASDAQIAIYSIAFGAATALVRLAEAVGTVVMPAVATLLGARQRDRIRTGYGRSFRLVLLAALPLSAAAVVLGPRTLALVYGSEYSESGSVLVVLAATFPVISLVSLSRALLSGLGRQAVQLAVTAGAAALNIALSLLLIPDRGALGAAWANGIAQLAGGLPLVAYSVWLMRPELAPRALLRAAAAAAAGGAAAAYAIDLAAGAAGLGLGLAAGALVWGALALGLRILPAQDGAWLATIVGSRAAPLVRRATSLSTNPSLT